MFKIVTKEPGKSAVVKEVETLELSDMQKLVGGMIQMVFLDGIGCILWCNEEGKLNGSSENIALATEKGEVFDIVVGDVFFAGENDEGDNTSLTDDQVEKLLKVLNGTDRTTLLIHRGETITPCPILKVA